MSAWWEICVRQAWRYVLRVWGDMTQVKLFKVYLPQGVSLSYRYSYYIFRLPLYIEPPAH